MATQPEDDDILNLTEDMKAQNADDQADSEAGGDDDNDDGQSGDEGPDRVTFEDEADAEDQSTDNSAMRQMRQQLRDKERRIRELETTSQPAKIEIGEKPTMESCGFDEDEFEAKLDQWKERKAAADRQEESQVEANRQINEAWQQDLAVYEGKKTALDFEDRDEAIETSMGSLDLVQQAVIVKSANDPALLLYALAHSPTKLAELAKIKDPIKMAAAVARMEGAVKVVKGRKAPDPDRPARGSASMPGGPDKQLEKLEKAAEKPGADRTELIAYKKKLREKGKQNA